MCNGSPNASQTYASAPPVQVEGGSPDSQNKSNPKERPELVYCQKVGDVAQELEDADDAIITVTTQGEEDSSVISDADWVGQVDDMASKFNDAADKAYAISPVPPKCKKLHRLVLRLADESRLVGKDFKKAVHEISVPEMNVATNHLRHQYELAGQVVKELGRLKSKLGL